MQRVVSLTLFAIFEEGEELTGEEVWKRLRRDWEQYEELAGGDDLLGYVEVETVDEEWEGGVG